ncbi:MAG: carbohydrate ABC transporter permease [Eubacteriales bacterium]|nr:carbohydrate ABC transporter permease [Eubacteriales bacterium]
MKRKRETSLSWQNKHVGSKILLSLFTLFVLFPIILALLNSFKPIAAIQRNFLTFDPRTFTLEAYDKVITILRFGEGLWNNIVITLLSVVMTVVLGSLMAFAISLVNSKFLRTVYLTSILLICIPIHAIILQLVPLLKSLGLLNTYLGTSFVFTALSLPVAVFLYTGFMRTLPRELSEAAVVDGCNLWRIYTSIYMPLMKTITVTVIILRATYIWNDLLVSLVTISDATKTMLVPRMYAFNSSTSTRWDLVLASSVLVSLPVAALYLFLQKFYMRGLVSGAVKE